MTRLSNPRLAAIIIACLVPPAGALIALAAADSVSVGWVILVLLLGLLFGLLLAIPLEREWRRRTERLEALGEALNRRQPPPALQSEHLDPSARAQRRLVAAADAVIKELLALDEQRDEFEAILRSMTEAVVVTGRRGEVVLLNGAARRMFELAPDADYAGRDFVELCRDPRLQEFVSQATRPGKATVLNGEFVIQNPAPRHLQVNAAPVRQTPGTAAAWVMVFHDITQLKSYETARADFVANLTHELRTPLSAICGYAETLLEGVDDPEKARRFLTIIERQSRRLARLIDDLVSLSDLERGLTPLKLESLDPRRVIEDAAELMREQAKNKEIKLELKNSAALGPISADRDRMHQVMLNLLDNALKYTPRGGHISIEARAANSQSHPNAAGVEFVVADTGEGIPANDIPRLTERFYRVDRARSRELGGTGLGLAIVKHIVQLHHGSLRIESRLREGTTVSVWLPAN